jgi:hypothetical protein
MQADQQIGRRWPLWTAAAGGAGVLANFIFTTDLTDAERARGAVAAAADLDRATYHASAVAGFAAVALLVVAAAGWWRFADSRRTGLAGRVVPLGLLASAGAGVLGYGLKGMIAIYLPGGMNGGGYYPDGLGVLAALDDLFGYITWWGVGVALLAIAWLGLLERVLPRWIGAVALLLMLPPLGLLLAFGFTGMTGVTTPLALVVIGLGLGLRGTAPVTVSRPEPVGVLA